ncbi:MAG: ice-binding family protein, partial [Melioribacteraceae bacterium]
GTLTLSGTASAIFIFQMSTTLTTAASSSVILSGGVVWTNVFWQVGSSATLGASSVLEGTILANTSISSGDGAQVHGRLLAGAVTSSGAVTLINNTALPVELTSFTATLNNSTVELNWNTATEVNNYGFNVELRIGNGEWNKIGFVQGHGNSNSPKDYSFVDKNLQVGKLQYRLKQIDLDGVFEYSDVVELEVKPPKQFTIYQNYPNPFNPTTNISYEIPVKSNVVLKVYDVLGSEVAVLVNEEKPQGRYQVEFKASHLPSGIYFYSLNAGNNDPIMKKMILLK